MFVEADRGFRLFGSACHVLIDPPARADLPSPEASGIQIEFFLRLLHRKLTRFEEGSELSALELGARRDLLSQSHPRSCHQRGALGGRRSGGLVDPTLVGELEEVGLPPRAPIFPRRASLTPWPPLPTEPPRPPRATAAGTGWRSAWSAKTS